LTLPMLERSGSELMRDTLAYLDALADTLTFGNKATAWDPTG